MQANLVEINVNYLTNTLNSKGKVVLSGIFFDTDKATIKSDSKSALQIIANYLKKEAM